MTTGKSIPLRIMTYNIHKGIGGVDRRYDLKRIVEVISKHQPDIAMLQEVDEGVPRSNRDRQVDRLADELNFKHSAFQRNVHLKQGHYGNAILSQFPLSEVQDLDLKIPLKKCRRALIAKTHVAAGGQSRSLVLCNAHLGLAGFERAVQIKKLLACETIAKLHHNTPAIIGGDFNDVWASLGRKLFLPQGFSCAVGDSKTFPAFMPVRSLDAIYFRGDMNLISSHACRAKLSRQASDHLPVIADFEIKLGVQ